MTIKRLNGILPLLDEYSNEQQEKAMKKQQNQNSDNNNE